LFADRRHCCIGGVPFDCRSGQALSDQAREKFRWPVSLCPIISAQEIAAQSMCGAGTLARDTVCGADLP
jgi:hypothetical protein